MNLQANDVRLRVEARIHASGQSIGHRLLFDPGSLLPRFQPRAILIGITRVALVVLSVILVRQLSHQMVLNATPSVDSAPWRSSVQASLPATVRASAPLSLLIRFCTPDQLFQQAEARWRTLPPLGRSSQDAKLQAEREQLSAVLKSLWLSTPEALSLRPISEMPLRPGVLRLSDSQGRVDALLGAPTVTQADGDGGERRLYLLKSARLEVSLKPDAHVTGAPRVSGLRLGATGPTLAKTMEGKEQDMLSIQGTDFHLGDTPEKLANLLGHPEAYGAAELVWDHRSGPAPAFVYHYQAADAEHLLVFQPDAAQTGFTLARIVRRPRSSLRS